MSFCYKRYRYIWQTHHYIYMYVCLYNKQEIIYVAFRSALKWV